MHNKKSDQEKALLDYQKQLKDIIYQQTRDLIQKNDELSETNEEFATANEELIESNKSLIDINGQLYHEIEKREEVEKKLRDSDKFFNHSTDMFCIAGFDGYFKVLNPAWQQVLGWSNEELLAKPWNEFVHPDDVEATKNIKSKIVDGKEVYHFENRYLCKDGSCKWLSWNSYPYPEEELMFGVARDVTAIKEAESRLKQIEWMLNSTPQKVSSNKQEPEYGDLTLSNKNGLIINSIEKEILTDIVNDYLSLLETSSAIYEKNGDYAMGIFSSGWCRFMDSASRNLCNTESNNRALKSGKWLCHESCWTDASKKAIETGKMVDVKCNGGLNLYVEPIFASKEVVGAINFGYGDPPSDEAQLKELAEKFEVDYAELSALAKTYESRPPFIVELAKKRLKHSAKQIGTLIEHDQAEKKLIESEERFRSIVQESPNGLYFYRLNSDNQLIFNGANPSADRIIGFKHEELLGKTLQEAFPNLANTFVPELYAKVARGEEPSSSFDIEYADKNAKGYFEVTVYQTEKNAVAVEFSDISKRKHAETKLRESERFLNESQRVSGIGSYTLDIEQGIWIGSAMFDALFGLTPADDHSINGWLAVVHPDDREAMINYLVNEVIAKKGSFNKEYRICPLNTKQVLWVHGIGELEFDKNGNPIKMTGTIQDITYRVHAEEIFNILNRAIEQSPNSIVITNTKGEIEYVNPIIEILSGYKQDELIGQNPRIFASGKTTKEEYVELWKTITSGKTWTGEFQNKKKNGELFWESANISPVFDNKGRITHYLAVREDVTQQKKMTQELIEAKEKAEESDRLKSSFLANMSHEIRTPMNSIMGFASLLPDEESKELMCNYAKIIVQNSEQLVHIIDDIVVYSQLQTKLFTYRPTTFNVNDLLQGLIQSFNLPDFQKGVELLLEIPESPNTRITSDYEKIRQVFTNLISNAFKYTYKGSISIGFRNDRDKLIFFVKDTGIGILPNEKEKVFERFFRGNNVNKVTVSGTGLGLSIVKELIDLLGGKIWVESEVGKGSDFYFTIKNSL